MGPRTLLLVLGFAAGLVSGCTAITIPFLRGTESARPIERIEKQQDLLTRPAQRIESDPVNLAPIRRQEAQEHDLVTAAVDPELKKSEPPIAPHQAEAPSSGNRAENREPSAAGDDASKRAAPAYWPDADDGLLDSLQKDLDKAVAQSKERRRIQFSKAVVENPRVRHYIHQFSKVQKEYLAKTLARSGKYFQMISNVLQEEGLPEELAYLALVESNFHPSAISRSGAVGLWQFVPSTARHYGLKIDPWIDERRDPVKSTRAAAAYLKDLHDYFGRWYLATAAYNAGQGAINRALQKSGAKDYWTLSRKNHLSEETRNFVPKFVAVSLIASNPQKYGFGELAYEAPLEYEEVEIYRPLRLDSVAQMADTEVETIRKLNPALLRNATPPQQTSFRLRLPAGKTLVFAKAYEQREKETEHIQIVTHEVRKGETLFSIARRYGQEVRALMRLNGLSTSRLRIGQRLMIIVERLRGGLR
ncbi:MAG: transglycosylase SLT domain-containing protein [Candidatus Binatia bacterium]